MHKMMTLSAVTVSVLMLSACGSNSLFNRERPDEMLVSRQAPLIVPPDFSLSPPRPGTVSSGTSSAAEQTLRVLFGGPAARSSAESDLIGSAGAIDSDPGIRSQIGSSDTQVIDKGLITNDILSAPEGDGREGQVSIPETSPESLEDQAAAPE